MKTERTIKMTNDALKVVRDGVRFVYQTYVEALKKTNAWNENTMSIARSKATEYIISHLSKDMVDYILTEFHMPIEQWAMEQVEIAIKCLKDDLNKSM